jgi:hypothetical protein
MADYKESEVTGVSWQRAYRITVENKLNTNPTMVFEEEAVVDVGDVVTTNHVGNVQGEYNPEDTFPLLNPETGEPLGGSITQAEMYVMLYSVYIHLAAQRDIDEMPVTPTETVTVTPTVTPESTVTPTIGGTPDVSPTITPTPELTGVPQDTPSVTTTPEVTPTITPSSS